MKSKLSLLLLLSMVMLPLMAQEPQTVSGTENGHEYVDLGLSVMWATCNIGATTPESYGEFYSWGEIDAKMDYSWTAYFYTKDEGTIFTKYNKEDDKVILESVDDVAQVKWKGAWRMPTNSEWRELCDDCTWELMKDGKKGCKVIAPNGNFIFLPAAGLRWTSPIGTDEEGYYWSSSLTGDNVSEAWYMYFSNISDRTSGNRCYGLSVRPVCKISELTDIDNTVSNDQLTSAKHLNDGQLFITRGGKTYDLMGREVK